MNSVIVDLYISRDEWLKLYRGEARWVHATSRDGRSIQFPTSILAPYTTHSGISGTFKISFDAEGKFLDIQKY